jgi:hypothetical protein
LAYVTGLVNQQLLLQNEHLVAGNYILKASAVRLEALGHTGGNRQTLRTPRTATSRAHRQTHTILAWFRKLVAEKFDSCSAGGPRISREIEDLVVRLARENSRWGYDRIVGPLANLGHHVSDQTVGNILRPHGIAPVPERSKTMKDFIRRHMDVLAGTDFFTI